MVRNAKGPACWYRPKGRRPFPLSQHFVALCVFPTFHSYELFEAAGEVCITDDVNHFKFAKVFDDARNKDNVTVRI